MRQMSTIDQSRLLQMRSSILDQNQALQRAAGRAATGGVEGGGATPDFGSAISAALQQVNGQHAKARELSEAYERGDTQHIVSVMSERQKASLGFENTLQVRNKITYTQRDTTNMTVEPTTTPKNP